MTREEFIEQFGGVFENSAWVAEQAWAQGVGAEHDELSGLTDLLVGVVRSASPQQRMKLILEHPILGTKKKMGEYSTQEQQSASLQGLGADKSALLATLNNQYIKKFGFPFILAVRGRGAEEVLADLAARVENDNVEAEKNRAMEEIYQIARLRLEAIFA